MSKMTKPILNCKEQISHLISKGVKFDLISIEDAQKYLSENNNYFKLRAYRKNFPKHPDGENKDKYINLDFEMLKDLAIIDMRLRYILIHLALDIEHFAKIKLLKAIENSTNDGYQIVEDYIKNLNFKETETYKPFQKLQSELGRNKNNPYCGGIINNYEGEYPVWAFIEIIPFGEFIYFYKYCADVLKNNDMKDDYYLFKRVKELRNATAHSNCIINELNEKNAKKLDYKISSFLGKNGVTKAEKDSKICNERICQIITILYTHNKIITSKGVHDHEKDCLHTVLNRMNHHIDYYNGNPKIKTFFEFFKKCLDIFFY